MAYATFLASIFGLHFALTSNSNYELFNLRSLRHSIEGQVNGI